MVSVSARPIGRWIVALVIAGFALGLAGLLTTEWTTAVIEDPTGTVAELTPTIAALGALVVVPAIAAVIGLYEGRQRADTSALIEALIGSFVGGLVAVLAALALIGLHTGPTSWPGFVDLGWIALLLGVTTALAGTLSVGTQRLVADGHADEAPATGADRQAPS